MRQAKNFKIVLVGLLYNMPYHMVEILTLESPHKLLNRTILSHSLNTLNAAEVGQNKKT